MLNKLFKSGKKSNGYYLQLDESKEATNGKVTEVAQAVVEKTTKVKEVVAEKAAPVKEAVKETVAATQAAVAEAPAPVKEVVVKTKSKKSKKSKTTATATNNTQASPVTTKTISPKASTYEEPFWVKVMYEKNNSNGNDKSGSSEQTFATDYLITSTNGYRRRPGPSLNKFKEMASKTKNI
jgi:hypothetical protein